MKKSDNQSTLEQYRREIARCVRCGSCSAVCPSFLADRRESRSPRGRIALIEAVLDGRLAVSAGYKDRLATCTGCLACEARCANGVPVADIILAAKEQAVRESGPGLIAGVVALSLRKPAVMRSLGWLAPVALHYHGAAMRGGKRQGTGATLATRERSGAGGKGNKRRIVFFPGCAIRHFQPDIGQSVVTVLERLGYEVVVPDELRCCGRPFLSLGDRAAAADLAARNTAVLAAQDAEAIVTACASCGLTFKHAYPRLLAPAGRTAVPVLDIHAFLADKVARLECKAFHARVTVHDPCHLGRGQGLAQTVREMLRAVPGVDLIEMKAPDRCCGFGGVMRATHPELSTAIGKAKARDIGGTGASLVVTGCPGCRMQIADALRRSGVDADVVHAVQLIAEACGAGSREPAVRREAKMLLNSGS